MSSSISTQEYYERTLKEAKRYYKAVSSATDWAEIKQRTTKATTDHMPKLHVFKRRELGKTIETFRATLVVDCEDSQEALDSWQSILDNTECRLLWDSTVEDCKLLELVNNTTKVTKILLKNKWSSNPRDLILMEGIQRLEQSVLYISSSLPPSKEQPKSFRPANPYVRANLTLSAFHIEAISSQQIKITIYHQLDLKGWISFSISSYLSRLIPDCLGTMDSHGVPPNIFAFGSAVQLVHRAYKPAEKKLVIQYKTEQEWKKHYSSESDEDDSGNGLHQFGRSMPSIGSLPIQSDAPKPRQRSISSSFENSSYISSSMNRSHRGSFMSPGFMLSSSPTSGIRANFGGLSNSAPFHSSGITTSRSTSYLDSSARYQYRGNVDHCPDKSIQLNVLGQKWTALHAIEIEAFSEHNDTGELHEGTSKSQINVSAKCYRITRPKMYMIEIGDSEFSTFDTHEMSTSMTRETAVSAKLLEGPEIQTISITLANQDLADGNSQEQLVYLNGRKLLIMDYIGQNRRWSKSESATIRGKDYFDIDGDVFGDGMGVHDEFGDAIDMRSGESTKANDHGNDRQRDQKMFDSQTFGDAKEMLTFQEPKPLRNARDTFFKALNQDSLDDLDSKNATGNGILTYQRDLADGSKVVVTESNWDSCSIWDVKAIVDCPGICSQWDPTYDSGQVIGNLSPRCTVHSSYYKSTWRSSLREYLSVNATYASLSRLRYVSLSFEGVNNGQSIAKQTSSDGHLYLLNGWQIDSIDDRSCCVKYLSQKDNASQSSSHSYRPFENVTDVLAKAKRYYNDSEIPPTLAYIINGKISSVQYDSKNSSWRCQYEQSVAQKSSPMATNSSIIYVRLPLATEATKQRGISVTIDPPFDHLLTVVNLPSDKTGIWLRIEHNRNGMVQDGGNILVLVKRSDSKQQLQVNGSLPTQIDFDNYAEVVHFVLQDDLPLQLLEQLQTNMKTNATTSTLPSKQANASRLNIVSDTSSRMSASGSAKDESDYQQYADDVQDETTHSIFDGLPVSTHDQAAAACLYLHRMSDQQFGWVHVSDRNGLRIQKRSGGAAPVETIALDATATIVSDVLEQQFPTIPSHLMLMKGTKVIEGFSVEEVASVVAEPGLIRNTFENTVLDVDVLKKFVNGHACTKAQLKAWFPFKARDVYLASTTARDASSSGQTTRILHASTSISNLKIDNENTNPVAHLYLSGWILEAVDPYTTTTNHPIPSTRVTYMGCLDLGQNIPAYISNMATSSLIKSIGRVEALLKANGPPPRLLSPIPYLELHGGELRWSGNGSVFTGNHLIEVQYVPSGQHWVVSSSIDRAKLMPHQTASDASMKEDGSQTLKQAPAASFSSTISKSPLLSERRGSAPGRIPLGVLSNKSKIAHTKEPSTVSLKSKVTLLDAVVDLKSFTKGYNCEVRFSVEVGQSIDLSDKLTARIEQLHPEPSHLVGSAGSLPPIKHHIEIKLDLEAITKETRRQLYTELHNYKLIFSLNPVTDDQLLAKTNKLTISGVLGEDEDKWKGMTLINGQEVTLGKDSKLTSLQTLHVSHTETIPTKGDVEAGEAETTIAAVLSNVVSHPALSWIANLSRSASQTAEKDDSSSPSSPAISNSMQEPAETDGVGRIVTSHIQDIGNMVLSPFIPTSPSPLALSPSIEEGGHELEADEKDGPSSDEKKSIRSATTETQTVVPTTSHSRSHALLRQFAVIFILSILIGVLLRSFAILAIDSDNEAATIRLLETDPSDIKQIWRMRWFGGWDIEFIAVKRR